MRVALATTVHDPGGYLLPGVERTGAAIRSLFPTVAVNGTSETDAHVFDSLGRHWRASVETHETGNVSGRARREAVRAALADDSDRVLYCDLDHIIRWVESAPEEVSSIISADDREDCVIVGRSPVAFARSPERLRSTESIVNHVYRLVTGREADVMFAVRLLSRAAAETITENCREDTMANDVEWPLVVEHLGLSVGYVEAESLDYRTNPDFDLPSDTRDLEPRAWIDRAEICVQHLQTMRRFIDG